MPAEREDFPVARVAALARLDLSPVEAEIYQVQLARIIEFVGAVTAAGVQDAAPHTPDVPADGLERPDTVRPSLPLDAALANAPDVARPAGLVRVPKVIG